MAKMNEIFWGEFCLDFSYKVTLVKLEDNIYSHQLDFKSGGLTKRYNTAPSFDENFTLTRECKEMLMGFAHDLLHERLRLILNC